MKIIFYDNKSSLRKIPEDHILIYTGHRTKSDEKISEIITDIQCTYRVGDQEVTFRKNTESTTLRFEDALDWAVDYARTLDIAEIHAVFALARPFDAHFLTKLKDVQISDKRRHPCRTGTSERLPPQKRYALPRARPRSPKSDLQRHAVLRRKLTRRQHTRDNSGLGTYLH